MKIGAISESLEDYLEIIHTLIYEKRVARVKDIANRKGVAMASVISALKRLDKANLIKHVSRGTVLLTPEGESLAGRIIGRHEFVKNFLVSILKVDSVSAERDACSFEHSMSPETFRKLVGFFEFLTTCEQDISHRFELYCSNNHTTQNDCQVHRCPFGRHGQPFHHDPPFSGRTLTDLKPGEKGIVARLQASPLVRQRLIDMGVLPNVEIELERFAPLGDPIEIKLRGYHLSLRKEEADAVILR